MTTRAKRVEQHRRNPAMARDSAAMRRAAGTRWTPEGRVRTAIKTLAGADREVVQAALREIEGVADIVIKRVG